MLCSELLLVRVLKVFSISLLILKASNAASLPCDYHDSIDITNGTKHPNNSISLNGHEFQPDHYAKINYKVENGKRVRTNPVTRGCPCLIRPCTRLCCPYGTYSILEGTDITGCTEHDPSMKFEIILQFHNGTQNDHFDGVQHFGFANRICEHHFFADDHIIYENGNVSYTSSNGSREMNTHRNYCIAILEDREVENEYEVMVCSGLPDEVPVKDRITSYLMLISVVFIIITIVIYLAIPELRNYKNTTFFLCYLICLAVSFILLSWIHLNSWEHVEEFKQKFIASLTYFAMLSVATWSNVISFDVWMSFRTTIRVRSFSKTKLMLLFMAYAWGLPLLILVFGLTIDSIDSIPKKWKPGIGTDTCFLKEGDPSKFLYYHLLFCIMFAANIVFFAFTAWQIIRVKRETKWSKEESRKHQKDFNKNKDNAILALRLFLMMGVGWILEGIPSDTNEILTECSDIFNCLQPVLIFFVFLLRARARKLIKRRWNELIGKPTLATESGATTSTDSSANKSQNIQMQSVPK